MKDHRTEQLRQSGAEVAAGDLRDRGYRVPAISR
jgi:hypothetical protein